MYGLKCSTPSDINEHLPVLKLYASRCDTIVECGVRDIVSSYAFAMGLMGNPNNRLIMVDPYKSAGIDGFLLACSRENINASFCNESDLTCPLVPTDLLFIDTWHVYGQLKRELSYWHSSVRKYIVLHDTTVDEVRGETIRLGHNAQQLSITSGIPVHEINRGIWPAVEEFVRDHPEWKVELRLINNNGLTVLARQ